MSIELHNSIVSALQVAYFKPSMSDATKLQAFLFEINQSLDELNGGPLKPADVTRVISWMRSENTAGRANWALRYSKILNEPENFRDLVLERRRKLRKPVPQQVVAVTQQLSEGQTVTRLDAAPVADLEPVGDVFKNHVEDLRRKIFKR